LILFARKAQTTNLFLTDVFYILTVEVNLKESYWGMPVSPDSPTVVDENVGEREFVFFNYG
jgi:hypothetical protein